MEETRYLWVDEDGKTLVPVLNNDQALTACFDYFYSRDRAKNAESGGYKFSGLTITLAILLVPKPAIGRLREDVNRVWCYAVDHNLVKEASL